MMKKILVILAGAAVFGTSCKKYLDINQNPNSATTSTPELVLPQAIVATASNIVSFNNYGGQIAGYFANGGGVSGWGAIITYNYTTSDFSGLWSSTYDNLNDFAYVEKSVAGKIPYAYFIGISKIMKAYNMQLLVDAYNDVPYSAALQGISNIRPSYDKGTDIYKQIATMLDKAVDTLKLGLANVNDNVKKPVALGAADVMFKGDITSWIKFANTLKLRLIVRAKDKVTFDNTTFSSEGFLTDDAIVNPVYTKTSGKQNPFWEYFAYTASNTAVTRGAQYVPTPYIMSFYDGSKLADSKRANVVYQKGTATATNQLGYVGDDASRGLTPNSWYIGSSATSYSAVGIFKGPDAGQPILLGAESYFLQAEAVVRGIITGDATTLFNAGIEASYKYLYKNNTGVVPATYTPTADAAAYRTANATSYLANFALATTPAQQTEAIITQKYIALNMINSHEAWNEYRRTGYPTVIPAGNVARQTFASLTSQSTRADKLPARILYPDSEFRTNDANVPRNINAYTSLIFWAK